MFGFIISLLSGVTLSVVPTCSGYNGVYIQSLENNVVVRRTIKICKNDNTGREMTKTLMHEIGHHYWFAKLSTGDQADWIKLYDFPLDTIIVNKKGGLGYYHIDKDERFAENFAYYFLKGSYKMEEFFLDRTGNKKYEDFMIKVLDKAILNSKSK